MRMREVNREVFYADEPIVQIDSQTAAQLLSAAGANPRKRVRLCAHRDASDAVHEMLIVLARGTYVRPHKHPGKSESFHVVSGEADIVLFSDEGKVEQVIRMGDYASGRCFFYRLADPIFHTVIVRTETFLVHETTRGPFDPAETVFASWAPAEEASIEVSAFQETLVRAITQSR
jgi:cupin fold WbuC family metalloprotein